MSWLTDVMRPRIKQWFGGSGKAGRALWTKCSACGEMLFHRDLEHNLYVCPQCEAHLRMPVRRRLESFFDDGAYQTVSLPESVSDPLKFKDSKRYTDRITEARSKTGEKEAILVAHGFVEKKNVVVAAMNFDFMGGSMGVAVGHGFVTATRLALMQKAPLIAMTASGGARMQEGVLSLMQMPRTVAALQELKAMRLPYLVVHCDPTTGGVSASFAMLGDIHMAEPGAMIGFAGRRVIEQTVRETLPDGFQTAEYLLEHGMVDMVVPRRELRGTVAKLTDLLVHRAELQRTKSPPGPTVIANDLVDAPMAAD